MTVNTDVSCLPALVAEIAQGSQAAEERLFRLINRGMRFLIARQIGLENLDDIVQDSFLAVVRAIRDDRIEKPESLMTYIRTVVQRQVALVIANRVHWRTSTVNLENHTRPVGPGLEEAEDRKQRTKLAATVIKGLPAVSRDLLHRFYVLEQSQEEICRDLGLTEIQFRNKKRRAKRMFQASARAGARKPVNRETRDSRISRPRLVA
jgi:RNA polymerase sigma-70 factor (ECF subfamily)